MDTAGAIAFAIHGGSRHVEIVILIDLDLAILGCTVMVYLFFSDLRLLSLPALLSLVSANF